MQPLSLVLVAVGASLCTAHAQQSKNPTKADLALQTPPVSAGLPPAPLTGGSDDCATAAAMNAIMGPGNFAVDTTAATLGATPAPTCTPFVNKDVWFEWTATFTGNTSIALCGHTTADTVLAVWTGAGCPSGVSTECTDDSCGVVSSVTFATTNGTVYMIQVGMYGPTPGVVTSMDITSLVPPANDDCSTPIALATGDVNQAFNTTTASTGTQGQSEPLLCTDYGQVGIGKDVWYTWTATKTGSVDLTTCGLMTAPTTNADTKLAVYLGTACPTAGSAVACNDDSGHSPANPVYTCAGNNFNSTATFNATCAATYLFQIGQYPLNTTNISGAFQVTQAGSPCSLGTVECSGDTAALCPCSGPGGSAAPNPGAAGNGCANSASPAGAILTATGNAVDNAGDTVLLTCSNMTGPGLFFQSNGTGDLINFGDGRLCALSGIIRMGVVFPAGSTGSYPGGLTPNPIHIAGAPVLQNGSPTAPTKHYQCWYRDITVGFCNGDGYNTSNGLAIVWAP